MTVAATDVTVRVARCDCGREEPSSPNLPFFQFRGEGSPEATDVCVCGFYDTAHEAKRTGRRVSSAVCDEFTPRGPLPTDIFYCGCRGFS